MIGLSNTFHIRDGGSLDDTLSEFEASKKGAEKRKADVTVSDVEDKSDDEVGKKTERAGLTSPT